MKLYFHQYEMVISSLQNLNFISIKFPTPLFPIKKIGRENIHQPSY